MRLNYHGWKAYQECPKKYRLEYMLKEPPTVPRNDYFALYGKLMEKFFEMFSNIWRFDRPHMFKEEIRDKLLILYDGVINSSVVNWSTPFAKYSKNDIFEQAFQDTCTIMDSPNQNYFLNTKSEVEIEVKLKDDDVLTSRVDFLHHDPMGGTVLIDGKGTNKIGKNISNNQLYFYNMMYFFHYKILPCQTGFFYYRFNSFHPIDISADIVNGYRVVLSQSLKNIKNDSEYKATPSPKSCKYCSYQNGCQEYSRMRVERAKPSKVNDIQGDGLVVFGI